MLARLHDSALDGGTRKRAPGTQRFCAVTGAVRPVEELMRFVIAPDGTAVPDLKRRLPGRGIWITATRQALRVVRDGAGRRGGDALGRPRRGRAGAGVRVGPRLSRSDGMALAAAALSASAMWAANAATVSPAPDTADGKCHLTVANLRTMPHRSRDAFGLEGPFGIERPADAARRRRDISDSYWLFLMLITVDP